MRTPTAAAIRGLGVVIPAPIAWKAAAHVLEHGRGGRGYLGVFTQAVELPEHQRTGAGHGAGALILGVADNSPAAEARLMVGDVVVALGGQPVGDAAAAEARAEVSGRGFGEEDVRAFEEAVRRGKALVAAQAPEEKLDRATAIMDRYEAAGQEQGRGRPAGQESVPVVEEELSVGKRKVATGGARVTSSVVERPVQKTVHLREEHVEAGRKRADRVLSPEEAEAAFRRVLELDDENAIALRSLADLAEQGGRLAEAAGRLQELLSVDRSNDEARAQLARIEETIAAGPVVTGEPADYDWTPEVPEDAVLRAGADDLMLEDNLQASGAVEPLPDLHADIVFHLASPASVSDYLAVPLETIRVNSIGTMNMLEVARRSGGSS